MASDRPYRPGLSMDDAIAEIVRCRGTQFDPDIVDAVVRAVDNGSFTMLPRTSTQAVPQLV